MLRAAGGPAIAFADNPALLREVVRVAAYEADESLGADPFYVRLLAEDAAAGRVTADSIGDQPQGLGNYLDEWMEATLALADEEGRYEEAAQDLLGTLIVALGPISRADLEAINDSLAERQGLKRVFPKVIQQVRRFVVGDDGDGYALAHPRLRQHMRDHKDLDVETYKRRLLAYCARWRDHKSRYALTHYAAHLVDAGRVDDLYQLISKSWMETKRDAFHSYRPFAEDVLQAIKAAEAETPVRWEQLIPDCLIYATLGSMATHVPPEVLGVLVQTVEAEGLREVLDTARGHAALMQDRRKQADAYRLIGEALWQREKHDEAIVFLRRRWRWRKGLGISGPEHWR